MARHIWTPEQAAQGRERALKTYAERFQYRLEDVEDLLATGESPVRVAARLGTTVGALSRQLYRRGQPDLGKIFAREEGRQRREQKR